MTDRPVTRWRLLRPTMVISSLFGITLITIGAMAQGNESPENAQALAKLAQILSRPEFQWQEERPTLLQRIWEWFTRLVLETVAGVDATSGNLLTLVLAIVGTAALLVVIGYVALRFKRQLAPDVKVEQHAPELDIHNAEEAIARAQRVADEGDYRLALRYLYLSSMLLLHERGLINFDRSRTNREYLQSVAQQPHLREVLGDIVGIFDHSWYGMHAPDAQTYAHFRRQVETLREFS